MSGTTTKTRHAAVAGRFYAGERTKLEAEVDRMLANSRKRAGEAAPRPALGVVAPHAGYVYSGGVAARVFTAVDIPRRVIILSPNHTGRGPSASIWPAAGVWETPLGSVPIDVELTTNLLQHAPFLQPEETAHLGEHGVEVMLPFLLRLRPDVTFAAIVLRTRDPGRMRELGGAIAKALASTAEPVLVVASSDMNHYESREVTIAKDRLAIAKVEALDPDGLLAVCDEHDISMCGVGPTAATLHALKSRGLAHAELLEHATSGDVDGRAERVVGYAGMRFTTYPSIVAMTGRSAHRSV